MIICSICTIPGRIDSLLDVLNHLEKQTIRVDRVMITICKEYPRLEKQYDVNDLKRLEEYIVEYSLPTSIIQVEEDLGPCLKLHTPLKYMDHLTEEDFIFCLDDDCCLIHDGSIQTLLEAYTSYGKAVYGFMGVIEISSPKQTIFIHAETIENGFAKVTGVGGYRGVLYNAGLLDNMIEWIDYFVDKHKGTDLLCMHSDHIFSYYMRLYHYEERVVSLYNTQQYYLHNLPDSIFSDPRHSLSFKIMRDAFLQKMNKNVYPIQFCMDETKFLPLQSSKNKRKPFSSIIPGTVQNRNYQFDLEHDYYNEYNQSFYAITLKKAGWDCMRHLEIIASGAIPYFEDIEKCPETIMKFLPKESILQAMNLPGVSKGSIDMQKFSVQRYEALRKEIYYDTLFNVSGRAIANYILNTVDPKWPKRMPKILFISGDKYTDYQRCLVLTGFKRLLGDQSVVDYPKIDHIYKSYTEDVSKLYGRGFSYTKILENDPYINRDTDYIKKQIYLHDFDLIIFGSIHRGLPLHENVLQYYKEEEIIYICGEDEHDIGDCICMIPPKSHLFIREFQ
jgi:hypothetical protein